MVLLPYYVITYVTWGTSFDEIPVSLDCCITGLWQPINRNYVFNPIALRMAKTPQSFGHSECNRVKVYGTTSRGGNSSISFYLGLVLNERGGENSFL